MTSHHEMHIYAQQGDADSPEDEGMWMGLPANGEGWDKPSSLPHDELLNAADRVRRYNDAPVDDMWADGYERSQQYGNDLAMLADWAAQAINREEHGKPCAVDYEEMRGTLSSKEYKKRCQEIIESRREIERLREALQSIAGMWSKAEDDVLERYKDSGTECFEDTHWQLASALKAPCDIARNALKPTANQDEPAK